MAWCIIKQKVITHTGTFDTEHSAVRNGNGHVLSLNKSIPETTHMSNGFFFYSFQTHFTHMKMFLANQRYQKKIKILIVLCWTCFQSKIDEEKLWLFFLNFSPQIILDWDSPIEEYKLLDFVNVKLFVWKEVICICCFCQSSTLVSTQNCHSTWSTCSFASMMSM